MVPLFFWFFDIVTKWRSFLFSIELQWRKSCVQINSETIGFTEIIMFGKIQYPIGMPRHRNLFWWSTSFCHGGHFEIYHWTLWKKNSNLNNSRTIGRRGLKPSPNVLEDPFYIWGRHYLFDFFIIKVFPIPMGRDLIVFLLFIIIIFLFFSSSSVALLRTPIFMKLCILIGIYLE